ncbi:MAG: hypothetical protein KGL18_19575 [Burkholderiales bacterium]|nr:hypothetical protein [Burkholderiales bacterium]MDE1928490.1 hypothetical protein [Burkholderiales bacterium]MDE2160302.1 hypothetical protein [Burkholderiales bacterium]MDE2505172.1 hypothetical protein [Burkholderiales bacterium]
MEPREYRPVSPRRRLLIVLLAVATAGAGILTMLERRGQILRNRPSVPVCKSGQRVGCVGGMAELIMAPAASAPP